MSRKILAVVLGGALCLSAAVEARATACGANSDEPCIGKNSGDDCGNGRTCTALSSGNCLCLHTVPAVSEYGLAFLALLLGTAGLIIMRERKSNAPAS